jgi:hypothetical protein
MSITYFNFLLFIFRSLITTLFLFLTPNHVTYPLLLNATWFGVGSRAGAGARAGGLEVEKVYGVGVGVEQRFLKKN